MGGIFVIGCILLANNAFRNFATSGQNSLTPLVNVQLDLIKGSSLAAMITVPELSKGEDCRRQEMDYMTMYIL